ncbi:MAG: hypothetical protein Q4Q62_07400 [Thermoplasmata archaeon]|nr:hypothetical protein [Thermoplasmata archaeon]
MERYFGWIPHISTTLDAMLSASDLRQSLHSKADRFSPNLEHPAEFLYGPGNGFLF